MSGIYEQRTHRITIRLTDEEYRRAVSEAEKNNITISAYIRQGKNNKTQSQNTVCQICRLFTLITKIVGKYEIAESDKENIKREVHDIWGQLK